MTMSQLSVLKLYNTVVDDVIAGVRDSFLDDGVDEQVLQELKQLWKTKLQASGAMDPPQHEPAMPPPPPPVLQNFQKANGNNVLTKRTIDSHMAQGTSQQSVERPVSNIAGTHPHHVLDPSNKVPVQLTLPAQPGIPGSQPRSFTIQIPASALNGNKLHQVLTGPIINATISLPQPLAATLLQQHINSALASQQNDYDGGGGGRSGAAPFSLDGALDILENEDSDDNMSDTESVSNRVGIHQQHVHDPNKNVSCKFTAPAGPEIPGSQPVTLTIPIQASALNDDTLSSSSSLQLPNEMTETRHLSCTLASEQNGFDGGGGHNSAAVFSLDGALDSSDDEGSNVGDGSDDGAGDDDEDEESPEERAEEEEEERDESGGAEEEPLNSGDDVSDEEPGDMFDTDNVVVCQYDKITRSRNKWKFYLKDGIMNLSGKDFVFQKANGDAEW